MEKERFLNSMATILEVQRVELDDNLSNFSAWDSLAMLSIIAMADEEFGVSLTNGEIRNAKTVEGVLNLVLSKKAPR